MSSTLKYRFEYVKGQIDAFDYFTSQVKVKKVGLIYKGLCPFHNEKSPSFTIYPVGFMNEGKPQEHASFSCFGCSVGGDIFSFRKLHEKLPSTVEALKNFEKELGIDIEETDIQITYMKEVLKNFGNAQEQILSIQEINMVCSSICRNYIEWVKDNFNNSLKEEMSVIEKFYAHFDFSFSEKNAVDCMDLIFEVQEKIEKRRKNLLEKEESFFG